MEIKKISGFNLDLPKEELEDVKEAVEYFNKMLHLEYSLTALQALQVVLDLHNGIVSGSKTRNGKADWTEMKLPVVIDSIDGKDRGKMFFKDNDGDFVGLNLHDGGSIWIKPNCFDSWTLSENQNEAAF